MEILIDADLLVYEIGHAAQKEGKEPCIREANLNLTSKIKFIKSFILDHWPDLEDDAFKFFLTAEDKSNFRFDVATIQEYKGNRVRSSKPQLYNELREVLQEKWSATVVYDQEADDELSIRGALKPEKTVIVSKDKDLRMSPGWHWEGSPDKPIYWVEDVGHLIKFLSKASVSKETGKRYGRPKAKIWGIGKKWFYFQCLIGDGVDNIPGIPGCGPMKAFKLLNNVHTEKDLEKTVLDFYIKEGYDKKRLDEVKQLLWMRRER